MTIKTWKTYIATGLQLYWLLDHLTPEQLHAIDVSELGDADLLTNKINAFEELLQEIRNRTREGESPSLYKRDLDRFDNILE